MVSNLSRGVYLDRLYELVCQGEDIVIVSADLGAPNLDKFQAKFPTRFVNVGIAEQNLISVSCGLALAGKKVIAYTASPFPVLRGFDQIRNAVSLMNIPIHIVAIGTGFSISEYGATHYNIEDISLIRTCPHIQCITVSDTNISKKLADQLIESKYPSYVRFDKMVEQTLGTIQDIDFSCGFRSFGEGSDVAIITNGYLTQNLLPLIDSLKHFGINAMLIDLYSLPFDEPALIYKLNKISHIITIEEHVLQGGLGSAILEAYSNQGVHRPIKRIGLDFHKGYPDLYGNREYCLQTYGLDRDTIEKEIINLCEMR